MGVNPADAGPPQGGWSPLGGQERSDVGVNPADAGPPQGGCGPLGGQERSDVGVNIMFSL